MASETGLENPMKQQRQWAGDVYGFGVTTPDSLCRFAGGIAHDFNNLLTIINGYGQLLISENPDIRKFREYGREIFRAGDKAAEIVDLVLAYAGQQSMWEETFDINEQLEKMRDVLSLYLGESISLNFRLCSEPAFVGGDRGLFHWALTNIFMNAKEAMPNGGSIELATRFIREGSPDSANIRHEEPWLEISVRDTGHGMTKEVLDRIFDPYFTTKPRSNAHGQGLGLACTKGIVRQFRGSIAAESALGAGTLIRIGLPIAGQLSWNR